MTHSLLAQHTLSITHLPPIARLTTQPLSPTTQHSATHSSPPGKTQPFTQHRHATLSRSLNLRYAKLSLSLSTTTQYSASQSAHATLHSAFHSAPDSAAPRNTQPFTQPKLHNTKPFTQRRHTTLKPLSPSLNGATQHSAFPLAPSTQHSGLVRQTQSFINVSPPAPLSVNKNRVPEESGCVLLPP